jgi:hypothetical protein
MMMMMMPLYSGSSLKQHSTGKHVDPLDSKPTSHAIIIIIINIIIVIIIIISLNATRSGHDIAEQLLIRR